MPNGGTLEYSDGLEIDASAWYYGVYGNGKIDVTGNLTSTGATYSVFADSGKLELYADNMKFDGDKGVWAYYSNSEIYLEASGKIEILSDDWALRNQNKNTKINLVADEVYVKGYADVLADNSELKIDGRVITVDANSSDKAVAVFNNSDLFNGFAENGSSVILGTVEKESIVTIKNAKEYALYADGKGASIVVNGNALNIEDTSGVGLYAGNSEVGKVNSSHIDVNSNNTKIIMKDGIAIQTQSYGIVNVNGGLEIKADTAIQADGKSKVNINQSGKNTVKIDGDINFWNWLGEAEYNSAESEININLNTADSYLKGSISVENDGQVNDANKKEGTDISGMILDVSSGATWTVTGDSFVSELTGDGGNVKVDIDEDGGIATVGINNELSEDTNVNFGATAAVTDYIAENGQKGIDELAQSIKAGNKVIDEAITTDESDVAGSYTIVTDSNGNVTSTEAINTTNDAIGEASVGLKAHWRAHMNDMNKRMGELRNANGEHGVWTRMVRGESEYEGAKAQYNQYQLGYDEKLSVDKRWTVGAAVTFAEGDSNFGKGSTEDDSTAFAIYGSKLNNDGTFVDLIARYAHLESDVTVDGANGDYSTNGMSVSAEFGKRIQQGNGLWIEPQVELTYGSVDSAEYMLDGKKVQVGDIDSLIGRVGFSLGKDIKQGNVYARASYLYDFDGETDTTFSIASGLTRTIKEDLGGGWWEVGVGANINLSKATYIYADIEKTFGGEVDTNWQWNLGVRYSF